MAAKRSQSTGRLSPLYINVVEVVVIAIFNVVLGLSPSSFRLPSGLAAPLRIGLTSILPSLSSSVPPIRRFFEALCIARLELSGLRP